MIPPTVTASFADLFESEPPEYDWKDAALSLDDLTAAIADAWLDPECGDMLVENYGQERPRGPCDSLSLDELDDMERLSDRARKANQWRLQLIEDHPERFDRPM